MVSRLEGGENMSLFVNGNNSVSDSYPLPYSKVVDLTGLDNNKWYPCQVTVGSKDKQPDFIQWLEKMIVSVPWINSNKVEYGTYGAGYIFASMTVKVATYGWGARPASFGYITDDFNVFVKDNKRVIACIASNNNNGVIFYLRGGEKYIIYTKAQVNISLHKNGLSQNDETFNVLDTEPENSTELIDLTKLQNKIGGVKPCYSSLPLLEEVA